MPSWTSTCAASSSGWPSEERSLSAEIRLALRAHVELDDETEEDA